VTAPHVLDAGTAPAFAARVATAAAGHRRVTVDLRHVVAVDAAGLRVLRRLADGLPLVLRSATPSTRMLLSLTFGHADRSSPAIHAPKAG
jgi:anti-anti-sigma regulatory factor